MYTQINKYRLTFTVVCPRRPALQLLRMADACSMALGISAGVGGTSSTRAQYQNLASRGLEQVKTPERDTNTLRIRFIAKLVNAHKEYVKVYYGAFINTVRGNKMYKIQQIQNQFTILKQLFGCCAVLKVVDIVLGNTISYVRSSKVKSR